MENVEKMKVFGGLSLLVTALLAHFLYFGIMGWRATGLVDGLIAGSLVAVGFVIQAAALSALFAWLSKKQEKVLAYFPLALTVLVASGLVGKLVAWLMGLVGISLPGM